jgi:hypothetical protein
MHEENRVIINFNLYNTSFSLWRRNNKDKNSVDFDKELGIGSWKKIDQYTTVIIKDKVKFFLAKIKYGL